MTRLASTSRSNQAECLPTAPQGTVTQPSHKYVTRPNRPFFNGTNTLNSGEAEQDSGEAELA